MDYYSNLYEKYVKEYVQYGITLGYFNNNEIYDCIKRIRKYKVVFISSLEGDAKVDGYTLYINPKRTFISDEYASEVLFHEFTHINSRLNDDIKKRENGLFSIFVSSFHKSMKNQFNITINKDESDNENNLDNYGQNGVRLLDEAVAQFVSEDMLDYKFNRRRIKQKKYCSYIGEYYNTNFNYYGIFEEIADKFSKTLAGINGLKDFSKAALKDGIVKKVIKEHTENSYAYEALYNEFTRLGILLFAEYYSNGHIKNQKMPDKYALNAAYHSLNDILDDGLEERNYIDTHDFIIDRGIIRW